VKKVCAPRVRLRRCNILQWLSLIKWQNYQNHFNCVSENRSARASVSSSLIDQPGSSYLGPTFREVRSDCALAALRNQRKSGGQCRLGLYLLLCFAARKNQRIASSRTSSIDLFIESAGCPDPQWRGINSLRTGLEEIANQKPVQNLKAGISFTFPAHAGYGTPSGSA
jgi:hypothetical protein